MAVRLRPVKLKEMHKDWDNRGQKGGTRRETPGGTDRYTGKETRGTRRETRATKRDSRCTWRDPMRGTVGVYGDTTSSTGRDTIRGTDRKLCRPTYNPNCDNSR